MSQKYNPLLQYGFQEVTSGGGGGGTVLTNSIVPKNQQLMLNPYKNGTVNSYTGNPFPVNQIYFGNLMQGFQIFQDTDIQDIEYQFLTSSPTERAFAGLYRYDYTSDVFTLVADWTIPATVAAPTTVSLPTAVTLSAGTYYFGMTCFDQTADAFRTLASNYRPLVKIPGQSLTVNNSSAYLVEANLATPSVLPISISGSSLTYRYQGFVYVMPTPKFQ